MGDLATAKRNRELNTLAICNKAPQVLYLEVDVMGRRPRSHLDFLDTAGRGMALGIVFLLLLRVAVLVEIGNPANRRSRGRRDFDQVEAAAFCHLERIADRQDTDLAAVGVDNADLLRADLTVDPYGGFS